MFLQSFLLLLSVLFSIPLSTKVTIVDDPGVFNFSPFYDPASGVIGLSLTFFPSEEGDTVYIPDYIYENNQYKYVVCINTGAFFDCHAKYIRLPNHRCFRLRRLAGLTNDTEHVKKLREWIKRNPKRARELGYTNM